LVATSGGRSSPKARMCPRVATHGAMLPSRSAGAALARWSSWQQDHYGRQVRPVDERYTRRGARPLARMPAWSQGTVGAIQSLVAS